MELVYSISEIGCSYIRLTLDEWLSLPETRLFSLSYRDDIDEWLFFINAHYLAACTINIKLLRVDGCLYKLDGQYRKAVWLSGKIPPPEFLIAQVFDISDAGFIALNTEARDKQMEALSPNEIVKMIYEDLGLVFSSSRLKDGLIIEAFNIALRGRQRRLQDKRSNLEKNEIDMFKAVQLLTPELMLLDRLNIKSDVFVTGVLAGALIMLGIGKDVGDFLVKLNLGQGVDNGVVFDPIAALSRAIADYRIIVSNRKHQIQTTLDLCKKTIQAINLWIDGVDSPGYWRKRGIQGIDHMPFVRELRHTKKINEVKDL
jgi:hypothetical protein